MRKDRQRRSPFEDQRQRAEELLNAVHPPMAASEIARVLAREGDEVSPGERTIRNWIASGRIQITPDSAPWTVHHAERPEDIALVLEVVEQFAHPTWWITVAQGRWIAKLRRAFPTLEPTTVLDLARLAVREDGLAFTKRLANISPS